MAGLFDIILADPPWLYAHRKACGSASKFGGGAGKHYPVMKEADLQAIPVSQIAAPNALLFMWATWPHLETALRLIRAWDFKYVTCGFDWFKIEKSGDFFFGVGFYAKSNSEFVLLARRGKPLKPATQAVSSAFEDWADYPTEQFKAERPGRQHSRKPQIVLQRISQMYPAQRKLEMFARRAYPGWVAWGNELTSVPLLETVNLDPAPLAVPSTGKQTSFLEQVDG